MTVSLDIESDLENRVQTLGHEIFEAAQTASVSLFDPEFYTGKLINWAMEDEEFRISLFRFVDVLPSLQSSGEVLRHVQEYFRPVSHRIPGLMKWGLNMDPDSFAAKATAAMVRKQISGMAERFILGENPHKALKALKRIRKEDMAFTVDILGEAAVSEQESAVYLSRYLELLHELQQEVPRWSEGKPLIEGHPGEATPVNISVKLSALYSQAKPVSHEDTVAVLTERLGRILEAAVEQGAFINVDMEDTRLTGITIDVMKRMLLDPRFRDYDRIGMVFQTYLRRTEADLADMLTFLKKREARLTVRLVKGAYWDTETVLAKSAEWPLPVWQDKAASDRSYETCSRMLLDHTERVIPAFGSHNIRSLCYAIAYAESKGLTPNDYEIQALFGMAEPIKAAFVQRGYLVREYAPIGELIPGMGYLVRRLLENTSNKGFIRQGFHEDESAEVLMKPPQVTREDTGREYLEYDRKKTFRNRALVDFTDSGARARLAAAIETWLRDTDGHPREVHPVVCGKSLNGIDVVPRVLPEDKERIFTKIHYAGVDHADQAIEAAEAAFAGWRDTPVEDRADLLFRTADLLQERRDKLTAAVILETGKPWVDADGDIAEAIDFLNYYGRAALELFRTRPLTDMDGEENFLFYEPRGVSAVIGPWNFPVAIPCGMFSASLVTGNPGILKPAEQSSLTASLLFQAFLDAGMPPAVGAFLPGRGETLGRHLVEHPRVQTLVFTGSMAVGLQIINKASVVRPGQRHVKRVIAEMGGKNAIVVDSDADLDQAVKGILYSAYGYAGQKCSACSRLIVVESVSERLMERLADGVKSLQVGPASNPANLVGPVIDAEAFERLQGVLQDACGRADVVHQPELTEGLPDRGYFIPPTLLAGLPDDDPVFRDEFFGPILAVRTVETFEEGIAAANDSAYALTGAVFSRSPEHLKLAAREFRVGNLYLNRGCTGSLVGRHPFGGAAMSGVGSKAGGPDYLLQFVVPRSLSENTMRQGFAPMEAL